MKNIRIRRQPIREALPPHPMNGEDLMSQLPIHLESELRKRNTNYAQTPDELLYSMIVSRGFTYQLHGARSAWHIEQKYPTRDRSVYNSGEIDKVEAYKYLETLPSGTNIRVAAAIGRQLVVRHWDGAPDKHLHWPMEAQGMLWVAAERPSGKAIFVVGDDSGLRLTFDAENEPTLSDVTKYVSLTSSDPEPDNRHSSELYDYRMFIKLPDAFERVGSA